MARISAPALTGHKWPVFQRAHLLVISVGKSGPHLLVISVWKSTRPAAPGDSWWAWARRMPRDGSARGAAVRVPYRVGGPFW